MKKIILLNLLLVSALVVFASSNKETKVTEDKSSSWQIESEDGILPGVNPLKVEGDIISAGSSTVFPLSEAMAERFSYNFV